MFSLSSEERCGHLVTEDMKKLWATQMQLLKELQRICKKHNIKYYAIEGTLLGAVRHNGYIPWDDDIDVGMPVKDFDKFCKVVKKELPSYYEFQHFTTQDGINVGISRIRDSRTTCCTKYEYELLADSKEYNCGVFIDIFPLFGAGSNKIERKIQSLFSKTITKGVYGYLNERKKNLSMEYSESYLNTWLRLKKLFNYKQLAQMRFNILKMFPFSRKIGMIGFYGYDYKYIWDKKWFEEIIDLPFEDTTISCPKEYHKLLTKRYGDYNVFVKGTAVHSYVIVDTETPYPEKLKEHYLEMQAKA